jgi:hypothetical protein
MKLVKLPLPNGWQNYIGGWVKAEFRYKDYISPPYFIFIKEIKLPKNTSYLNIELAVHDIDFQHNNHDYQWMQYHFPLAVVTESEVRLRSIK